MTLAHAVLPHDLDAEDLSAGPSSLRAEIRVDDARWRTLEVAHIADTALSLIAERWPERATLDLLFADDATLQRLNAAFRGKDRPTNVLAFPASPDDGAAGDAEPFLGGVALAFETMAREAAERGISIGDHTTHLTVHGVLHLLGFDHGTGAEQAAMEALEIEILARLGIANPYEGS